MKGITRAVMVAGVSVAAGVAGYALGLVFAPASGEETRRRWKRRAGDEWSAMSRSCERMFDRVSARAKAEIEARLTPIAERATHECG